MKNIIKTGGEILKQAVFGPSMGMYKLGKMAFDYLDDDPSGKAKPVPEMKMTRTAKPNNPVELKMTRTAAPLQKVKDVYTPPKYKKVGEVYNPPKYKKVGDKLNPAQYKK